MKKHLVQITLTVATLLMATPSSPAQETPPAANERIGVYDSRAIAVAYVGSSVHANQLRRLKARHDTAKAAGDLETTTKLEAEALTWQTTIHRQAFGTAAVDDILAHLGEALPEIEKKAGVTALVSKWNEPELKKHPGAERVDITMALVDAFRPSERQRHSAIEIQKHEPVRTSI